MLFLLSCVVYVEWCLWRVVCVWNVLVRAFRRGWCMCVACGARACLFAAFVCKICVFVKYVIL